MVLARSLSLLALAFLVKAAPALSAEAGGGSSSKRPVPDYDGREPTPAGAREAALWVPRLLLSPLYLTSEFVIRRPLGVVIPAAERVDLFGKLREFFTFGPNHEGAILPVGFAQFGFKPSVGIYAYWRNALRAGHDLRLHAEVWPPDWMGGWFRESVLVGQTTLELRLFGSRRPDLTYYGMGGETLAAQRGRYGEDRVDVALAVDRWVWRLSHLQLAAGVRSRSFRPGSYGGDPSVQELVAQGALPAPAGLADGYTAPYQHLLAVLDSRRPWPWSGSGLRLKLQAEHGTDVRVAPASGWLRQELTAAGFYDLTGYQRVVSLSCTVMFADPIGPREVPFTELVALGGDGPMRGFAGRRLTGRSAAVLAARYQWPVGPWLAGTMTAAVGNVFDAHLAGLRPDRLRLSGTVGLAAFSLEYPFEILLGLGTDTFGQGAGVSSVVFSVGVNRGI